MCEHSLYGNNAMNLHSTIRLKRSESLELVHSDVHGPMPTISMGGASYFVTFIDDFSQKFRHIRSNVRMKSFQSSSILSHWLRQRLARKSNIYVLIMAESMCQSLFKAFVIQKVSRGISLLHTLLLKMVQQKRMNWIIQERLKSMLSNAELSNGFWVEVLANVVHLVNRSPNKRLDSKVAQEIWSGKPPSFQHL